MPKTVEAVYEEGVFRPLEKVKLHEHQKVELSIYTEDEKAEAVKAALSIIGIGKSAIRDASIKHDEYLYGKKRCVVKKR